MAHEDISGGEIGRVVEQQRRWAERHGWPLDPARDYLANWSDALMAGDLEPRTRAELEHGAGKEPRRLHSLRSSTCLAVNVFEPWRNAPGPVGGVLGASSVQSMEFESEQPTGLGGTAPHLDVLLTGTGPTIGIECKFVEMYEPSQDEFRPSYFNTPGLWSQIPRCGDLARQISNGECEPFRWLGAGQLLKHALGLSKNQPGGFRLVLVWHRVDGPTADQIDEEIDRFAAQVDDHIGFRAITYQNVVASLAAHPEPVPGYFDYLADRYGLEGRMAELPLLTLAKGPKINHLGGLADTIRARDPRVVADAYRQTVQLAPRRPSVGKRFFVDGHDGGGAATNLADEKVLAKAIFNQHEPMTIGTTHVDIVDYEVPLRTARTDRGVGEIDLAGVEIGSGALWIIELKRTGNSDTPLKALLQALRYAAIIEANWEDVAAEAAIRFGARLRWPAVMAVAADHRYWSRHLGTAAAGDWLPALRDLTGALRDLLGLETRLIDLGILEAELRPDGRAHLVRQSHAVEL